MIEDDQLEEWTSDFELDDLRESGLEYSVRERALILIQALRAERQCNAVLREALEMIISPTKLGEYGDPWFYRKNRAERALSKEAEIRG